MTIKRGDQVDYTPHEIHATQRSRIDGSYPWVIGKKVRVQLGKKQFEDRVHELHGAQLDEFMQEVRSKRDDKGRGSARDLMVLVRPHGSWPAIATSDQHKDDAGKDVVDIDIESGSVKIGGGTVGNGFTLHYRSVPVGDAQPHTCKRSAHPLPKLSDERVAELASAFAGKSESEVRAIIDRINAEHVTAAAEAPAVVIEQ